MTINHFGVLYYVTTPAGLSALLLQLRCRQQAWS